VALATSTEHRAGASSHKFPTHLPEGTTVFDLTSDDTQVAATGWWPVAQKPEKSALCNCLVYNNAVPEMAVIL